MESAELKADVSQIRLIVDNFGVFYVYSTGAIIILLGIIVYKIW